jgi:hypothetical protein
MGQPTRKQIRQARDLAQSEVASLKAERDALLTPEGFAAFVFANRALLESDEFNDAFTHELDKLRETHAGEIAPGMLESAADAPPESAPDAPPESAPDAPPESAPDAPPAADATEPSP